MVMKPEGYFEGAEGKSSKRLQSFLGLLAALVFPLACGLLNLKLPIAEITTGFLVYSAALQGVSYFAERKGKK